MVFPYNTIQIFFPIMNSVIFLQKSLQNIYINYKNELKHKCNQSRNKGRKEQTYISRKTKKKKIHKIQIYKHNKKQHTCHTITNY